MAGDTRVTIDGSVTSVSQALSRPAVTIEDMRRQGFVLAASAVRDAQLDEATLLAEFKYSGYLKRHDAAWRRAVSQDSRAIPHAFTYTGIPGLSREVIERLSAVRPATLGQAGRVPGVTPAAVAILAARLARS
jgi:tRNA uridine 5-carboxymethylaminomethyl modification enzyme